MIPLPLFLNNTTNGTCEFWQQLLRWQDSNVHQTKLHFNASVWIKNEGTIFKISDRGVWDGHFFSPQTVTWSSEDACTLFCPGHLIFKLRCVQLHQTHCLFYCPALTAPSSDLSLPNYCCQHFCLNIWVCFLAEHSFPPAHPIALEVRVVLAEHAACACCTSWPT